MADREELEGLREFIDEEPANAGRSHEAVWEWLHELVTQETMFPSVLYHAWLGKHDHYETLRVEQSGNAAGLRGVAEFLIWLQSQSLIDQTEVLVRQAIGAMQSAGLFTASQVQELTDLAAEMVQRWETDERAFDASLVNVRRARSL
jgi:hypothetical protein